MPSLQFILANLTRARLRAIFTILTVVVAFVLFGLLLSLERVFNIGVKVDGADRLLVANKSSIMQPLPVGYKDRIAQVDNVEFIAPFVFMGAFFQNPNQPIVLIATEPRSYVHMVPEIKFNNPAERDAWFSDRASIMIGRELADKYHWKVGDLIPLYSVVYPKQDNSNTWTFRVAAIFDTNKKDADTKSAAIHLSYLEDMRLFGQGTIGWYVVRLKDGRLAEQTGARIEALFANSPTEVKAGTEAAFTQDFLQQVGDFGTMISLALSAVFCTLALVVANTMAQSVNERTSEIAVLKALGFGDLRVFAMVYAEGFIAIFGGGLVGMAIAGFSIPYASEQIHLAENMTFLWNDLVWGALAMLVVTIASTVVPASRAMRLKVTDGLARAA